MRSAFCAACGERLVSRTRLVKHGSGSYHKGFGKGYKDGKREGEKKGFRRGVLAAVLLTILIIAIILPTLPPLPPPDDYEPPPRPYFTLWGRDIHTEEPLNFTLRIFEGSGFTPPFIGVFEGVNGLVEFDLPGHLIYDSFPLDCMGGAVITVQLEAEGYYVKQAELIIPSTCFSDPPFSFGTFLLSRISSNPHLSITASYNEGGPYLQTALTNYDPDSFVGCNEYVDYNTGEGYHCNTLIFEVDTGEPWILFDYGQWHIIQEFENTTYYSFFFPPIPYDSAVGWQNWEFVNFRYNCWGEGNVTVWFYDIISLDDFNIFFFWNPTLNLTVSMPPVFENVSLMLYETMFSINRTHCELNVETNYRCFYNVYESNYDVDTGIYSNTILCDTGEVCTLAESIWFRCIIWGKRLTRLVMVGVKFWVGESAVWTNASYYQL